MRYQRAGGRFLNQNLRYGAVGERVHCDAEMDPQTAKSGSRRSQIFHFDALQIVCRRRVFAFDRCRLP